MSALGYAYAMDDAKVHDQCRLADADFCLCFLPLADAKVTLQMLTHQADACMSWLMLLEVDQRHF